MFFSTQFYRFPLLVTERVWVDVQGDYLEDAPHILIRLDETGRPTGVTGEILAQKIRPQRTHDSNVW